MAQEKIIFEQELLKTYDMYKTRYEDLTNEL